MTASTQSNQSNQQGNRGVFWRFRPGSIIPAAACLLLCCAHPALMAEDSGGDAPITNAMNRMLEVMTTSPSETAAKAATETMQGRPPLLKDGDKLPMAQMMPEGLMPEGMMPKADLPENAWPKSMTSDWWEYAMPEGLKQLGRDSGWLKTTLDGIWEGRDGGLLIVRDFRFRLYQPRAGSIDGLIQQRGDRIALYDLATQEARPYEYAQSRGRLVLRDGAGRLFLYRRLWMNENAPASPPGLQPPLPEPAGQPPLPDLQ